MIPIPAPVPATQVPSMAKQPSWILSPPVAEKVEVAVCKLAIPCIESIEPGEVVPIPNLPVSDSLAASVKSPDLKVENRRSPFPVPKFWVSKEVMAEVVVAPSLPLAPVDLKSTLTAVVVAEAKLARIKGVEVAAEIEEVAVTTPNTGVVVAERVNVYVLPD